MAPGPHFVCLCTYIFVRSLRHTQFSSSQFCHGPSSFVVPISLMSRLTQSTHLRSGLPFFFQVAPSPESFVRCSVGPVSSRVQTTSVLLSYTSMLYALPSVSPRCYNFSHGLLVCGRMPIYKVIFISVTSIFFTWVLVIGTVSIPYSRPYS